MCVNESVVGITTLKWLIVNSQKSTDIEQPTNCNAAMSNTIYSAKI